MATKKLIMDGDKVCIAFFRKKKFNLTTSVDPAGSGTITPASGKIDKGTEVIVNAVPAEDYEFDHFTVNGEEVEGDEEEPPIIPEGAIIPQDYATGTGTVDDPWANDCIKKAYDFVPAGGTIYLKAGYYILPAQLTITKQINIIGEGMGKTIVVTSDAHGFRPSRVGYVTIKNLTVDGAAQRDNVNYRSCIDAFDCDYLTVENVELKNSGQVGVSNSECNYSLFKNIYTHDNYSHGVHPSSNTVGRNQHNTYRDIYAWNNGRLGFADRGDDNNPDIPCYNVYDNLNCWDNGEMGIYIAHQRNGILSNSSTSGNTTDGITLQDVEDFNIHDCSTTLNGMFGFKIYSSENVNFTNVIVKNNNVSDGGAITGIRIEDSSNIKFTSCQSYDDRETKLQVYALKTVGSVGYIELVNCTLTPNAIGAISNPAGAEIIITND